MTAMQKTAVPLFLTGTPADIQQAMIDLHPALVNILLKAREIRHHKAVEEYQAAVIYHLASRYAHVDAHLLEIGCARGYSGSIIARAAPTSFFLTITPDETDHRTAQHNLATFGNARVGLYRSVELLSPTTAWPLWDFIFVDGDHKRVKEDLPFFNHLTVGGMILFHDWSPADSARPCPPVFDALIEFAQQLGRTPDVDVVDDQNVGMLGFVRREGETWAPGLC